MEMECFLLALKSKQEAHSPREQNSFEADTMEEAAAAAGGTEGRVQQ